MASPYKNEFAPTQEDNSQFNTSTLFQMKRKTTQTVKVEFPKDVYLNSGDYTMTLPKLGDVITRLQIVANFNGNQNVRESLINKIDFIVNSNIIESLKGDFIKIDNELNTSLEKLETSNVLVATTFDIPFYIIKKGFFMVTEPKIRFSFKGDSNYKLSGYLNIDYTLIEDQPKPTFFQRIRQVQDISVVCDPACNFVKIDTAFTGPVFQIYFTVEDLNTGTLLQTIENVKFLSGGNFERFNLSGTYLQFIEPNKRYGGLPIDPVYLYSFALNPSDIHNASGQMNFSRLDLQRFEINLYPVADPVKVTIWVQSHNFCYFNNSNCSTVFETYEYMLSSKQLTKNIPSLPITVYPQVYNTSFKILTNTPLQLSSNVLSYQNTTNVNVEITNISFNSPGYSNALCNFYITRYNPLQINFSDNTMVKTITDLQTDNHVILFGNYIWDQYYRKQLYNPSLTYYDIITDYNGNFWISYLSSSGTYVINIKRQTYSQINSPILINSSNIGKTVLFCDSNNYIYCSYFNSGYNLLNISTGSLITIPNSNSITIERFTNSVNYAIFNDGSVNFTYGFLDNFDSRNNTTTSTNYYLVPIYNTYYDGTSNVTAQVNYPGFYNIFINGIRGLPIDDGYDGYPTYGQLMYYNLNNDYTLIDSFFNAWVFDGNQCIYKVNTSLLSTMRIAEYTYFASYGTQQSYNYSLIRFDHNIIISNMYEDPVSHYIVCCGNASTTVKVSDTLLKSFTINPGSFIIHFDSFGRFDINETTGYGWQIPICDLQNYKSPTTYFNPEAFETPLHPIMYPPFQYGYSSNIPALYGSGMFTVNATSNVPTLYNAFSTFDGPNYWISDGETNPNIQIYMGNYQIITNLYVNDNLPITTTYSIDCSIYGFGNFSGFFNKRQDGRIYFETPNRLNILSLSPVISDTSWLVYCLRLENDRT